ncbi:unnamed protein product [Protopolystoma xenopodis]|uniref:Uncharacterized protein n=1 Tax=Protopolystoma xenopodis TaxID=117903 RepID=A0A3S5CVJ3_9PLAT|nr:unnamed protein product [Protopolystoma xenopodis]
MMPVPTVQTKVSHRFVGFAGRLVGDFFAQLDLRALVATCQSAILHCHGSTPAGGVDKTDARSKLQSTGA